MKQVTVKVELHEDGGFSWTFDGVSEETAEEMLDNVDVSHFCAAVEQHIENEGLSAGYFFLNVTV